MPKRTRTPQGTEVKTVDLNFIQAGHTPRSEVEDKLKLIDTGYRADRFFLGRWASSNAGGWAFVVGLGGGMGNASRIWKNGNLLIEFDENGVVRRSETFSDSQLLRALVPVVEASRWLPEDRSELWVKSFQLGYKEPIETKIVLSTSGFEFAESASSKKPVVFTVPARDVLRVKNPTVNWNGTDPTLTTKTIEFAANLKPFGGPRGRKLDVELSVPQLVTILNYISHSTVAYPESIEPPFFKKNHSQSLRGQNLY
ncbi:MAG TPA: hypothetical protein VMI32_21745 [Candidatus Solibacter sp.]|nr:hypothetical protein [Candidatus Solibacter sp.]